MFTCTYFTEDGPAMASRLSEGLSMPIEFVELTDIEAYNTFVCMGCTPWKASGTFICNQLILTLIAFVTTFGMLGLGGSEPVHQDCKLLLYVPLSIAILLSFSHRGYPATSLAIWARDNYVSSKHV